MAPNDDPKGYYRILGLACNASHAQIVHAYREWAKKYHPDTNETGDASNFVRMKDAYDILSDPSRRSAYDSSAHGDTSAYSKGSSEADKEGKEPPAQEIDAVRCCHCGVISAQPRYCIFHRVISFIFYTHTAEIRGVYCAQCARRRSLKESAICWLLGWWSIVGVFQTPVALLRNLLLGDKPSLPNARLLLTQGLHFNQQRQFALAHACFAQGKAFADGEILGALQAAQEAVPSEPSGVLKDQWTWRSATTCAHMIPVAAVTGALVWYGSLSAVHGDGATTANVTDRAKPTVRPATNMTVIPDIRHVAVSGATAWVMEGNSYVSSTTLPQFSTVRVLRSASDHQYIIGQLRDGRTVAVTAAALASGDGWEARIRWCREQAQVPPGNNEILKRTGVGRNRVIIKNLGTFDAVTKFRGTDGAIAVSLFVAANSTTAVDDFPDGSFRLEFATGHEWSRRCNTFLQDMRAQRFPDFDYFISTNVERQGYRYTITPVMNGNVKTEPLAIEAFEADNN